VVIEGVQPTSARVPHSPHVAAPVPVEGLGQPRRGPDQPGRMAAVAGGRGPKLRRVVPPGIGCRPSREQPRDRGILRSRDLQRSGEPRGIRRECRTLGSGTSPGGEHHKLSPRRGHVPPLSSGAVPCGPRRSQGGSCIPPCELSKREVQLHLRPEDRVGPFAAQQIAGSRRRLVRETRGQQCLAPVPAELHGHVVQTREPDSGLVVEPQRARQVAPTVGEESLVVPGLHGLEVLALGLKDLPRLLQRPVSAGDVTDVQVQERHGDEGSCRPHPVTRAASATQGAPQVGQGLAVPPQHQGEHVATAHQAPGPELWTDRLNHSPIELLNSAAGAPVKRQGAAEGRSYVGESIRVAAAPRQLPRRPQLPHGLGGPTLVAQHHALGVARHGQHPRVDGHRGQLPRARRRSARLGDGQSQQLPCLSDLLAAGHRLPLPPPPGDQ
jgi:hypothetical protein